MDRASFLKLNQPRWVKLFLHLDLEVELTPGRMPSEGSPSYDREVCNAVFTNFRNWTEDGKPIDNTLEERLSMFRMANIRDAIRVHVAVLNNEAAMGEAVAASV